MGEMVTQEQIIKHAQTLGFEDVGFTSADPFDDHKKLLVQMPDEYGWTTTPELKNQGFSCRFSINKNRARYSLEILPTNTSY